MKTFMNILSAGLFTVFLSQASFAQEDPFSNYPTAIRHWLGEERLVNTEGMIISQGLERYHLLQAYALHDIFKRQDGWTLHRHVTYDPYGRETGTVYQDIVISNTGDKVKDVPAGGVYFFHQGASKSGAHLMVTQANGGIYFYYRKADESVALEFQKEILKYRMERNFYRGGILQYNGSQFTFLTNVGNLKMKWEDLILEQSHKAWAYDQTEGFLHALNGLKGLGISRKKGVLLYGPPGTGKSLVGQILFTSIMNGDLKDRATAIIVTARTFQNIYATRILFEEAQLFSPGVLFVEDVDLIGGKERTDMEFNQDIILNEFLNAMDGLTERAGVLVVGTTNHLDSLDPAILRAERFGTHLYFGLPAYAERKTFFLHFGLKEATWGPGVTAEWLAGETEGLSGADIIEIIRYTKQEAYMKQSRQNGVLLLLKEYFEKSIRIIRSSNHGWNMSRADHTLLKQIQLLEAGQ